MYSQYNLGTFYLTGQGGVKQDQVEATKWLQNDSEAIKWFKKSAEQGNMYSQYNLGTFYLTGQGGVKQDQVEATKWLEKAAKQGHIEAQHILFNILKDQ